MAGFDPWFGYNSLLVHFDGIGGGTTFTDSAQSQTITNVASTTTVTSFPAPAVGTASGLFNGSTQYLTLAASSEFNFGTGDFTIEGWIYPTGAGTRAIFTTALQDATETGLAIYIDATNFYVRCHQNTVGESFSVASWAAQWYHFAVVRQSGTMYIYLDGVAQTLTVTGSSIGPKTLSNTTAFIGANYTSGTLTTNLWAGNLDDLRVTKGYARYPSGTTFTRPTGIHPDAGTIHLSTFNGTAGATTFTEYFGRPWVQQVASVSLNASFAKFGATGLYLPVSSPGTGRFTMPNGLYNFGTDDFSIEMWFWQPTQTASTAYDVIRGSGSTNRSAISIDRNSSGNIRVGYTTSLTSGAWTNTAYSSNAMNSNAWNWIGISRVGANFYINLNDTITTGAGTASALAFSTSQYWEVYNTGTASSTQAIDDFRVTKGYARHTP